MPTLLLPLEAGPSIATCVIAALGSTRSAAADRKQDASELPALVCLKWSCRTNLDTRQMDGTKGDADQAANRSADRTVEAANLMVTPFAKCDVAPLRGIRSIIKHIRWQLVCWSNVARIKRTRPAIGQADARAKSCLLCVAERLVTHHRVPALQPSAWMCNRRDESALWRKQEQTLTLTVKPTNREHASCTLFAKKWRQRLRQRDLGVWISVCGGHPPRLMPSKKLCATERVTRVNCGCASSLERMSVKLQRR